ncbi:hypothetical protein [Streptomyces sp. NPDC005953]|uniref:hypothetical protein n=1 Tax=Streptomyces sp. NPDC005953 TaxID=3156719 RepID=UPI0033F359B9
MPWQLTATSRTHQPVNPLTGASTDSITVYDQADLDQRLKAAESDPRELTVTVHEVTR